MPLLLGMIASPRHLFLVHQVRDSRPSRYSVRPENVDIGQLYAAVAAFKLDQRTIASLNTLVRQIILHIVVCE